MISLLFFLPEHLHCNFGPLFDLFNRVYNRENALVPYVDYRAIIQRRTKAKQCVKGQNQTIKTETEPEKKEEI